MQVDTFGRAPGIVQNAWRRSILYVACAAVLASAAGCHRTPGADVVATVNNKDILRTDLEKLYTANVSSTPQQPSAEQANVVRLNILRGLIEDEILQQRAAKLNLAASDEDVNAKLTEWKAPYTQEEFERQLKQRNLSVDDLKRDIRRSLTKTKLMNKEIESKINITDSEIGDFYNANRAGFNYIEPVYHLARIMVTGAPQQPNASTQNRRPFNEAEARKEVQSIHNRLESGEAFEALAGQFTEDASYASSGGDMGFIPESQIRSQADVYEAVGKLKPNQITDPMPVYDAGGPSRKVVGYAIYELLGREAAGQRELNDPRVQQAIRSELRNRKVQLLENAYLEMLHDEAKVRNYFAEEILKQGAH